MNLFEIKNLCLVKGRKNILDTINLSIPRNKLSVIIGPNGSGKSSLLKCLANIEQATQGSISFNSKPYSSYSHKDLCQSISWLPDRTQIHANYTVYELVSMGRFAFHQGYPRQKDHEIVRNVLNNLELDKIIYKDSSLLSSGEYRKVMLARALAADTQSLLLDEPEAHLDIEHTLSVLKLFKQMVAQGKSICVCLHHIHLAAFFADHVIILKQGRCVQQGETHKVLTQNTVQQYFGVDMNFSKQQNQLQVCFNQL